MPTSIDSLQIEINAKATSANDAIDRLVRKLDTLSISLGKINGKNLTGLANGVERLGKSMQLMNNVKTADFTRLARNLERMGTIDTASLNATASSMSHLTRSFNQLGTVSTNAIQIGELAKNISKLGNKGVQNAVTNVPLLAKALNELMITLSKSPTVSQNVINMTNALANLANQGSKVGSASNSIKNGLNNTYKSTTKATKSFGGLASAIGKFYASYFLVIRGIKGLWASIESTADYIEAYNYFNVALGKIGSDWAHEWEKYADKIGVTSAEEYAESFSTRLKEKLKNLSGVQVEIDAQGNGILTETGLKNLGLNIQEVTQYASQLASVTNSVGQTGEVSLVTASAFTKLGADMSSLFNMDYSEVMNNLQSGLIGQSRALYKYGIDITNATLQTYAYNLGLSKSVSEMTQAEKMQLRMLAILEQSKVSWGDLANTINSPSNMIRQLGNNLKETGMVLGQLFIPVLQKVFPVLNGLTIAMKNLLVSMAGMFGIEINFDAFGQGYNELEDSLGDLEDAYDGVADSAKEWQNQMMPFDEMNKLKDNTDASTGIYEGAIDLSKEIIAATEEYERVWQEAYKKMQNASIKWAEKIESALGGVKKLISNLKIGDYVAVGDDVSQLVLGFERFVSNAIKSVDWGKIGENFGKFLAGIDWVDIFLGLGDIVVSAIEGAFKVWFGALKEAPFETALLTAMALWKFTSLGDTLATKIFTALSTSATGSAATKSLTSIGSTLGTGIIAGLGAAVGGWTLGNLIYESITGIESGSLTDQIEYLFDSSWDEIEDAAKETFNDLGSYFEEDFLTDLEITAGKINDLFKIDVTFKDISKDISDLTNELKKPFVELDKFIEESNIVDIVNIIATGTPKAESENTLLGWITDLFSGKSNTNFTGRSSRGGSRAFATGGFPEDGLFFANHNELVGQFSNGKTAVANNYQIVSGIAEGVGPAVYNAVVSAMKVSGNGGDIAVMIDGKQVFKAVRKQASNYTLQTGKSAF